MPVYLYKIRVLIVVAIAILVLLETKLSAATGTQDCVPTEHSAIGTPSVTVLASGGTSVGVK